MASAAGVIARDPGAVVSHASPAQVEDVVAVVRFHGPDEIRGFFKEVFDAFPDLELTIDRVIAGDEATALQWHATAGTLIVGAPRSANGVVIRRRAAPSAAPAATWPLMR